MATLRVIFPLSPLSQARMPIVIVRAVFIEQLSPPGFPLFALRVEKLETHKIYGNFGTKTEGYKSGTIRIPIFGTATREIWIYRNKVRAVMNMGSMEIRQRTIIPSI